MWRCGLCGDHFWGDRVRVCGVQSTLLSEYLGKSGHLHSYLGYLDVCVL